MRFGAVVVLAALPMIPPACCGVGRIPPRFGLQANVIVWDADRKIEHFIRNASFVTPDRSLGFIAPTPTVPELSKVSEEIFSYLASLQPFSATEGEKELVSKSADRDGMPEVIQEVEVAGFTATTLRATDSQGLAKWMKQNGYVTTPGIEKWTQYYIQKKWMLTAFKVSAMNGSGATGSVRMSFKTDVPFNSYYVPAENAGGPSGVKLFWLSKLPYTGTVADKNWISPKWSAPIDEGGRRLVAEHLRLDLDQVPSGLTVQAYEDEEFPTSAKADIEFHPVSLAATLATPSNFSTAAAFAAVFGLGFFVVRRQTPGHRRKAASPRR